MHAPPTDPVRISTSHRLLRSWIAAGVVLLVAVAGGCGTVRAFTDMTAALEDEGFDKVQVNVAGGDPVALTVKADGPPSRSTDEAHRVASELVWDEFPRRFEEARFTFDGDRRTVTRSELQQRFGDRPEGLDDQDLAEDINRIGLGLVLTLLVAGLATIAVIGLVTVLVVRSRRRSPRLPPPAFPPVGPGPGPAPWAPPAPGSSAAPPGPPPSAGSIPTTPPAWKDPPTTPPTPPTAPAWNDPPTVSAGRPGSDRPGPAPGLEPAADRSSSSESATDAPPRREGKTDRPRLGRSPRGPRPPASHTPPGWG